METQIITAGGKNRKFRNALFIQAMVVNMMVHLCLYMMNTLSSSYADYLGAEKALVGFASSFFALSALAFQFLAAPAIDFLNRKWVLFFSMAVIFLSFVGYTLSTTMAMLLASRFLTGIGLAFIPPCCMTIASDSLPAEKMGMGISFFSLGAVVCQAIAPALGLNLVDIAGYRGTFGVLTVIILMTSLFTLTLTIERRQTGKFRLTFYNMVAKETFVPTSILFFLAMTFSVINAFLVLHGNLMLYNQAQVQNSSIGIFFTVYAVTMIFSRPLIGSLTDRYGLIKVLFPSLTIFAGSFIVISQAASLPVFLVGGIMAAFGYGGCQPALMAACMKLVPKERRGAASSTSYIGVSLGTLFGPVIAGLVTERYGYTVMWRTMIIPIACAVLVGVFFSGKLGSVRKKTTAS
jgi:MFS family permease